VGLLTNYLGELAALLSALVWACAAVIFSHLSKYLPALGLNFAKAFVALPMILGTLILSGQFDPALLMQTGVLQLPIPFPSLWLLLGSGLIGIAIGDTFYLGALGAIGARRTLLLSTLSPPMAAILALILLQEQLSTSAGLGIGLTLAGVGWVISERTQGSVVTGQQWQKGMGFALLFALAQAIGALLSRAAFVGAATAGQPIDPLWAAGLRLSVGCGALGIWGGSRQELGSWLVGLKEPNRLFLLVLAAFMGTFLGIWLQQLSLKYAVAGIAQTLSSTSPLFVLPIAILLGEQVSPRAWFGVLVTLAGIAILFWQT
jgi:drug/metabolite transporter (DMT)-like permease